MHRVEIEKTMRVKMAFEQVPSEENMRCKGCWFHENPFFDCKQLMNRKLLPKGQCSYEDDDGEVHFLAFKAISTVQKKYY